MRLYYVRDCDVVGNEKGLLVRPDKSEFRTFSFLFFVFRNTYIAAGKGKTFLNNRKYKIFILFEGFILCTFRSWSFMSLCYTFQEYPRKKFTHGLHVRHHFSWNMNIEWDRINVETKINIWNYILGNCKRIPKT